MKHETLANLSRFSLQFAVKWWRLIVFVVCGCLFTVNAFAGTYNFFFSDKRKKAETVETDSAEGDDKDDEEAKKEEPKKEEPKTDSVKATAGQTPIIINNVNNNDNTNRITSPPPVIVNAQPAAPVVTVPVLSSVLATESAPVEYATLQSVMRRSFRNRGRFGLSGGHMNQAVDADVGQVLIGFQISKTVSLDGYVGVTDKKLWATNPNNTYSYTKRDLYAGIDMTWAPLRISFTENWDLIQVGMLFGGSTLKPRRENIGTFHAGVHANVSLGEHFTVYGQVKANFAYVSCEAGIITKLF